jgi:uncharacterized membrane protein YfcA
MKILLLGIFIGALAGLVGALCGVGGGLVMVPAFVLILGMTQKSAVATSLAIIVVTAFCGTLNHVTSKSGLIDWKVVGVTAIGAALAAWFGSDLMKSMSSAQLTKIFGIILVVIGVRMLLMKA